MKHRMRHGVMPALALVLGALAAPGAAASAAPVYDVVLRGGRVMDPETRLDAIRDLGILNGKVAAISAQPLPGRRIINAQGLIVAPGFIDLHAHGQHPHGQELQALDGVTTAIEMEAGAFPVATFYSNREGHSLLNFGASVGHRCARVYVKTGRYCPDRLVEQVDQSQPIDPAATHAALSDAEQEKLLAELKGGLATGGLGIGLGIDYTPGAGRAEIYDIFKVAAQAKAPVHVHVRRRATDFAKGIGIGVVQEVIADAALTGAPLQIVHITSTALPGEVPVLLDMMTRARQRGLDITTEAYPYTAASTALGAAIFDEGWRERTGLDFGDLQWAKTGERLTKESFERLRREEPRGNVIIHAIPESDVVLAMKHPLVSIASDGMWWVTKGEHPRGAGTFSRVLGVYVRQQGALDLMAALEKMTLMPARRLEGVSTSMRNRGRITVGAEADITVFDPRRIIDHATFAEPMLASTGVRFVLVGGQLIVERGKLVRGVAPGKAIRRDVTELAHKGSELQAGSK